MLISMLKSKLHAATVTACLPDYEGSIEIDSTVLRLAKMVPYEKVLVANLANGNRFETYTIPGEPGSKCICLNGAAALLGSPGDKLIILSFALIHARRIKHHKPTVVVFDSKNRPSVKGSKKRARHG